MDEVHESLLCVCYRDGDKEWISDYVFEATASPTVEVTYRGNWLRTTEDKIQKYHEDGTITIRKVYWWVNITHHRGVHDVAGLQFHYIDWVNEAPIREQYRYLLSRLRNTNERIS